MERITIYFRPTKTSEVSKIRFRLRGKDGLQLWHKSEIKASVSDMAKFTLEGTLRPKVSVYNKELLESIQQEISYMRDAYKYMEEKNLDLTSVVLENTIQDIKDPKVKVRQQEETFLERFVRYSDEVLRDGIIGQGRYKHFKSLATKLERYLIINGRLNIKTVDFDQNQILEFRLFCIDEYKYVKKWKSLYKTVSKQNIPTEKRNMNTVAAHMKMLQAFFNELENTDEILKSPFRRLGTERRKVVMKTKYDDPVYLKQEELMQVMEAEVPKTLEETKNAFLLQCALGCRVSDFKELSMDKIAVTEEGIPYVHYLPIKTRNAQTDYKEVETPIVKYAFEIIKKTQFKFTVIKYAAGKSGYNVKIKELLRCCGIDRKVSSFDAETQDNKWIPLYELGSSKLCRKTHVDIMNKVQINMYAAGLHKEGSEAVERYTKLELKDRFILMCAAFKQPDYIVDENLNEIE